MGYYEHHAIILTGDNTGTDDAPKGAIISAYEFCLKLGLNPSSLVYSPVNAFISFFVPPDGSKEGWLESDEGDDKRELFKNWLISKNYSCLDWIEIRYGGDFKQECKITNYYLPSE
ncbi:MAG: hypothetical protein ACTSV7_06335 [Candidatus Baldrarchaeia archaeon]